jgi:hypothetical protein
MWDPAIVKTMDQIARDQITPLKGERRIIGYFSDNEQGWWEGALFEWAWKGNGTRSHLLKELRGRYPTWTALMRDFEPFGAKSYSELAHKGRLYLRPGGSGMAAVQAYITVLATRYYSLCASIVKHYDPGALYLGDRYISNFYPEVAEAAAPYADIVSTNLNADWNDGEISPFFLPTLERFTRRPLMITEYYMAAMENRSGNKNSNSGFPTVPTQTERAEGFRKQTREMLACPYVVGAHWFQYYDEPKNGRGDGENYDMGLVDTSNRPYDEMVQVSKELDPVKLHGAGGAVEPGSPPEPSPCPLPQGERVHGLQDWHGRLAWVRPVIDCGRGDLFAARGGDRLYLAVYWNEDRFGEAFYRSGKVPEVDRAHVEIRIGGRAVRLVGGEGGSAEIVGGGSVLGQSFGVRNTLLVAIPFDPTSGQRIRVDLATRGRAYRGRWDLR